MLRSLTSYIKETKMIKNNMAIELKNNSLRHERQNFPKKKIRNLQSLNTEFLFCIKLMSVGTTELYNSTKKRQHYFDILKAFFVRHSSEYKMLDCDRKVNRNIYPDAVPRDRMRLIDPRVAN